MFKRRTEKLKDLKEFLSISSKLKHPRINTNKYQGVRDEAIPVY